MQVLRDLRPESLPATRVASKMGVSPQAVYQLEQRSLDRVRIGTVRRYEEAVAACLEEDRLALDRQGRELIQLGEQILAASAP